MLLFNSDSSRLINKLSFIAKKACLWAKMVKSSKDGSWKQNKRWSRTELSVESLTFLKVTAKCQRVLQTLLLSAFDLIGRIGSSTLKFINNTRRKIIRQKIFKMRKFREISLAFKSSLDFTIMIPTTAFLDVVNP